MKSDSNNNVFFPGKTRNNHHTAHIINNIPQPQPSPNLRLERHPTQWRCSEKHWSWLLNTYEDHDQLAMFDEGYIIYG